MRHIYFFLSLFWLTSCTVIQSVEFQQADRAKIKTIALLRINESQNITAQNNSGTAPLLSGGVGAGIEAVDNQRKAQTFAEKLNENKLAMGPPLVDHMKKSLESKGYSVVFLPNEYPVAAPDGSDDFSGIKTDADAILVLWLGGVGYYSSVFSLNYTPFTTIGVRLVDVKTKQTLYFKNFQSGLNSKNPTVKSIEGCDSPKYPTFASLMADVNNAYNGIVTCQKTIGTQIANELQ